MNARDEIAAIRAESAERSGAEGEPFRTLLQLSAVLGDRAGSERMLGALIAADPELVLDGLRRSAENHAAHRETMRVRDEKKRAEEREYKEDLAKREGHRVTAWTQWLEQEGRAMLDAWRPIAHVPETCDAVWFAVGPDGNVVGIGVTPADAHRAALAPIFGSFESGALAADWWDCPSDYKDLGVLLYQTPETAIRFLRVEGSAPGLAEKIGQKLVGAAL